MHNEYAGEMDFKLIYLDQALNEEFNIYELFDTKHNISSCLSNT